jgi:hypothetical protein
MKCCRGFRGFHGLFCTEMVPRKVKTVNLKVFEVMGLESNRINRNPINLRHPRLKLINHDP